MKAAGLGGTLLAEAKPRKASIAEPSPVSATSAQVAGTASSPISSPAAVPASSAPALAPETAAASQKEPSAPATLAASQEANVFDGFRKDKPDSDAQQPSNRTTNAPVEAMNHVTISSAPASATLDDIIKNMDEVPTAWEPKLVCEPPEEGGSLSGVDPRSENSSAESSRPCWLPPNTTMSQSTEPSPDPSSVAFSSGSPAADAQPELAENNVHGRTRRKSHEALIIPPSIQEQASREVSFKAPDVSSGPPVEQSHVREASCNDSDTHSGAAPKGRPRTPKATEAVKAVFAVTEAAVTEATAASQSPRSASPPVLSRRSRQASREMDAVPRAKSPQARSRRTSREMDGGAPPGMAAAKIKTFAPPVEVVQTSNLPSSKRSPDGPAGPSIQFYGDLPLKEEAPSAGRPHQPGQANGQSDNAKLSFYGEIPVWDGQRDFPPGRPSSPMRKQLSRPPSARKERDADSEFFAAPSSVDDMSAAPPVHQNWGAWGRTGGPPPTGGGPAGGLSVMAGRRVSKEIVNSRSRRTSREL